MQSMLAARAVKAVRLPLSGTISRGLSYVPRAAIKDGDFVAVHYTGTLDDGSVFDSSRARTPLEFVVGAGKVIKGFDQAVMGLEKGGQRKARIEPEMAYGQPDPKLILSVPAGGAPKDLKIGVQVQLSNGMTATVVDMSAEQLTLDLNHELAGKHLTFDVEVMQHYATERLQKATFGAGCFWGPELAFQRVPGVIMTEVGYTNGTLPNPTYEDVCTGESGHCEVVQVVYDPEQVSFEALLDVFWAKHDPTTLNQQGGDQGTQYRSGIYAHTPEQREAALKAKASAQARFKNPIVTEVDDIKMYYPAEPYHQQYLSKGGRFGRPQDSSKGCSDPIRCYG